MIGKPNFLVVRAYFSGIWWANSLNSVIERYDSNIVSLTNRSMHVSSVIWWANSTFFSWLQYIDTFGSDKIKCNSTKKQSKSFNIKSLPYSGLCREVASGYTWSRWFHCIGMYLDMGSYNLLSTLKHPLLSVTYVVYLRVCLCVLW